MNRKLTFLVVGLIATIMPAVAIADVMITGNVAIHGTNNSNTFWLEKGSNFQTADGSVAWNAYSSGNYMGDLRFAEVTNQTTFIINVMEIHFVSSLPTGNFYLNSTVSSAFVSGSTMYLSLSPMSFSDFSYSGLPGAVPVITNPAVTAFPLSGPQSFTTPVDGSTIIYIGFFTPPYDGASTLGELFLTGTYTAS